ncbi:MAG: hypothetical protein AB1486_16260 [Planctomycetota bacterium]
MAGRFDSAGEWMPHGTVPPGLSGLSLVFRGWVMGSSGLLVRSNDAEVVFL